jgi:outer membrane receptor protein involved in Fe transport
MPWIFIKLTRYDGQPVSRVHAPIQKTTEECWFELETFAGYRFDLLENSCKGAVSQLKTIFRMDSYHAGLSARVYGPNRLYVNYSLAFRVPARDEMIRYEYDPWTYKITNIALSQVKPERMRTWEGGAEARIHRLVRFNLNLFSMRVDDEIFFNGSVNTNYTGITHQGAESVLSLSPLPFLQARLTHTYQKVFFSDGPFKGKRVPLSPENAFTASFSVSPIRHLVVSHDSKWRDRCFIANDLANASPGLKRFWVSDLKLAFQTDAARLEFGVYNLYNERYSEFAGLNWMGKPGFYPSARRNYEMSASFYF